MNEIQFKLRTVLRGEVIKMDGLEFRECAFVEVMVDGENFLENEWYEGSLPVYKELLASGEGGGRYLLFTCACGVADDADWECVEVRHEGDYIKWLLGAEPGLSYRFEREIYLRELKALAAEVDSLEPSFTLEPSQVMFPESEQSC